MASGRPQTRALLSSITTQERKGEQKSGVLKDWAFMAPKGFRIHEVVFHVADMASLQPQTRFSSSSTTGRL
jgi:hypothetical protein